MMINTTFNEAREIFLGKLSGEDADRDAEMFWREFSAGRTYAPMHHDTIDQRNVDAYLAFQRLGWDWPHEKPEGV